MKTLSRKEALALADKLESELRSDDPGLNKTVTLSFLDGTKMRIENAFIHKKGKWIIVLSEHHRAMVYDDEDVEYSEVSHPTAEEAEAANKRAEEVLAGCGAGGEVPLSNTCISIEFNDIFWVIHAERLRIEGEKEDSIRMFWGWTAGMSQSDKARLADDCPQGENYVYTSLDMAADLRDKLTELIDGAKR